MARQETWSYSRLLGLVNAQCIMHKVRVFLRRFRNPIRVLRISNRVPIIRENYHRVPKIWENRVPRIREIGSLQIHTGYLTFCWKKNLHKVFQLYNVLRFDSTVVINLLINISSPKLNNQIFFISKHRTHEYDFGLTSTPKAELFCCCKPRKCIDENRVKICNLWSQNFTFLRQKIGCPKSVNLLWESDRL